MNTLQGTYKIKNNNPFFSFTGKKGKKGKKYVEAYHLGNVNVVVSDKKIAETDGNGNITGYHAEILSAQSYYAFGMQMPVTSYNSSSCRYGFNGKEKDDEIKGSGNSYDYGFRMYDPRIGRALSVDPIAKKYPELSPYQFFSNSPIWAIDIDGLEAFFIHGTKSTAKRWRENPNTIPTLLRLTNNKTHNADFNWKAPLLNNEDDRSIAAISLAIHVLQNRAEGEDITLIGHSHGGNVAIQAADIIYKATGQKVNVITIATPAYNDADDVENPANSEGINQHTAIWNNIDVVSGGLAGDDNYTNSSKTTNVEINVDQYYKTQEQVADPLNPGMSRTINKNDGFGAHSFDVEHPEAIGGAIDNGTLKKQESPKAARRFK